ncbi:MAG: Ig-like domain repeat protein, partial [Acidobacteriia bacterium]|nr:Ig-like domain repeat protein [Terriglobia bacterium]
SAGSATFTVGTPGSFAVTATGSPTPTLSEGGTLPNGLSFNASTGLLSGTPAAGSGGTYPLTFTASNGVLPNAPQDFTLTVNKADTTTTITTDLSTATVVGQSYTVAWTVTANPPGSGTPTGTVTVSDELASCSATVASGQCPLTSTSVGAKTVTAAYAGNGTYNASASDSKPHTVNPASTTTTITAHSPNPSIVNQPVTVNFTVSVNAPGNGTPTGNVTVSDGTGDSCVGTVAAGTCQLTPATSGNKTLTATYATDGNFAASAFAGVSHTVNNPVPVVSSISPEAVGWGSPNTPLTINGTGFTPDSTVTVGIATPTPTFVNSTELTALVPSGQLATPGLLPVTVTNPPPGGGTSAPAIDLEVQSVRVSPSAPTLDVNQTQPFTAAVYGGGTVTWWVNDVAGGDSTAGTISDTGLYIAPGAVPAPNTVIVKAVSTADPFPFGTATATVTLPASDNYPRPGAGSILLPPGTLVQVPQTGWKVAVLDWTTREDAYGTQEDLLAVCHTLSPLGIPHDHVTSVPDPSVYHFLAVAGALDQDSIAGSSNPLLDAERDALRDYVQNGGTLFLWLPSDTGVLSRLNLSILYEHTDPSYTFRRPLTFGATALDHALDYIDYNIDNDVPDAAFEEAEAPWQMLYPGGNIPTFGYSAPGAGQVLATWDADGAAVRTFAGCWCAAPTGAGRGRMPRSASSPLAVIMQRSS